MHIFICVLIFLYNAYSGNSQNVTREISCNKLDIADEFVSILLNGAKNESKRIRELKDKLLKIDSYVLDGEKYAELLVDVAKQNNLTHTNFYDALIEEDHFSSIKNSKNLYLKLKEKMNSDDMLSILAKTVNPTIRGSGRRMSMGTPNPLLQMEKKEQLADAVDNYLAELPEDNHQYDYNKIRSSFYWDPNTELEDRRMYSRLKTRRLFRGERTTIRYYPFMVSIRVMGAFWCGGSLVWKDLVITSAACLQLVHNNRFYRENPNVIAVRVGSNFSAVGGEPIEALEVFFQPNYNPKTLENNIALIRLKRQVKLNYHRVPKLIGIAHNDQALPFTAQVMLLGWGVDKIAGKLPMEPKYLQRKFLPVYPSLACKEIYGDKFNPQTMFCAGTVTTGEGACGHDAGGPAILAGKLVGVISYGPSICGFPDAPTVLTLVGAFSDWIETVNESMPGYYRARQKTSTTTADPLEEYFDNLRNRQFRSSLAAKAANKKGLRNDEGTTIIDSYDKIEPLTTTDSETKQFTNMLLQDIKQTSVNPLQSHNDNLKEKYLKYQQYLLMMKGNDETSAATETPFKINPLNTENINEMRYETQETPLRSMTERSQYILNVEELANPGPFEIPKTHASDEDALDFINGLLKGSKEGSNNGLGENIATDIQAQLISDKIDEKVTLLGLESNEEIETYTQPDPTPDENTNTQPYLKEGEDYETNAQADLNQVENVQTISQQDLNNIKSLAKFLQQEISSIAYGNNNEDLEMKPTENVEFEQSSPTEIYFKQEDEEPKQNFKKKNRKRKHRINRKKYKYNP